MTVHTPHLTRGEPLTVDYLERLWQSYDEPLTPDELNLRHPKTPRILVAAQCVFAVAAVTILTATVWLLRVVGGA